MSKQIYIDSNGNEIQVSGTVNSADMLPIEAGSSKMTSEAIGDLESGKVDKTAFTKQSYTAPNAINIGANAIDTQTIAINNANFGIVVGFAITNNTDVVIMQCYFNSTTELVVRVRNVGSSAGTYRFSVIYI